MFPKTKWVVVLVLISILALGAVASADGPDPNYMQAHDLEITVIEGAKIVLEDTVPALTVAIGTGEGTPVIDFSGDGTIDIGYASIVVEGGDSRSIAASAEGVPAGLILSAAAAIGASGVGAPGTAVQDAQALNESGEADSEEPVALITDIGTVSGETATITYSLALDEDNVGNLVAPADGEPYEVTITFTITEFEEEEGE